MLAANAIANLARNLWSHSIIMCGHFPEGVETFEQEGIDPDETRGEWYLRQMLGSADISGSKFMHLMSGNLSHQIEHHLFPDLPSNRYAEIAVQVRDLFQRYGLSYNARPLVPQVASAWHRVVRLSLPNGWLAGTTWSNAPQQLRLLGRMALGREDSFAALPRLRPCSVVSRRSLALATRRRRIRWSTLVNPRVRPRPYPTSGLTRCSPGNPAGSCGPGSRP